MLLHNGPDTGVRCIDPYIALRILGEGSLGGGVLPSPPELSRKRKDAAFGRNPASWMLLCLGGWPCQQHGLLRIQAGSRSFFYVFPCKMIVSLLIDDFMNEPKPIYMYKCRDLLIQVQCPSLGIISGTPNPAISFRTSASKHLLFFTKLSNKTCAQGRLRVH